MRAFSCPVCSSLVFFENSVCITCHSALGYERASGLIVAVQDSPQHPCANLNLAGCNWLTDAQLCDCCALTRTRPGSSDADGMAAWARTEAAKRRLVFQLDRLALPTGGGLVFDLLSSKDEPVITGHDDGVITIDLAEGDDPHREAMRVRLAEPYRTLLGHLRHEVGHWYWQVLVDGTPALEPFRALFGDERADYADALKSHYAQEPHDDAEHVSFYAASHPWEDWAETFAHYLHIRDTMETAAGWGVHVDGPPHRGPDLEAEPLAHPSGFDELIAAWLPLSFALNAVNRSMGKDDLYPFVLSPAVLDKLRFVHERVG